MRKIVLTSTAMAALLGCTALAMAQTSTPQPRGAQPQVGPGNTITPSPSGTQAIPERVEPGPGASNPGAGLQGTPNAQSQDQQRGSQQGEPDKSGMNGGQPQTDQNRPGDGGSVNLSQDQRSKIKQMAVKDRGAHVDHANFSVKVGAVLPKTIHITVVPEDIVAIVPEYRGFDYVVVGEDILIINPDTLRIVAVIPA